MVEVRLGILNEHVQHLFAICQQISLNSGFRENGRLTVRNPFLLDDLPWAKLLSRRIVVDLKICNRYLVPPFVYHTV